jgi:hypothetical protein
VLPVHKNRTLAWVIFTSVGQVVQQEFSDEERESSRAATER